MLMLVVFGTRGAGGAVALGAGHRREHAGFEPIAQRAPGAAPSAAILLPRDLGGDAEADQRRHVLGAGAAVALLPAAGHRAARGARRASIHSAPVPLGP